MKSRRLCRLGGVSSPIPHPSRDAFGISIIGALCASSFIPSHFLDQSYAPGWVPGLPPTKSGPGNTP